ncbi:hypothetical protein ARMGADRAFT_1031062 [Armillaria gallica]|uniref:Uncharacterized protein n=1 Tax=Armillaria gallica TaxID=47427 RepID=A0A2H3DED4_ARMGA|nr:hypothetical protein ARMGADRAFT_1031062 [Armillaria gallica]
MAKVLLNYLRVEKLHLGSGVSTTKKIGIFDFAMPTFPGGDLRVSSRRRRTGSAVRSLSSPSSAAACPQTLRLFTYSSHNNTSGWCKRGTATGYPDIERAVIFELGIMLGFTDDIHAMSLGSRPYAVQIREARQLGFSDEWRLWLCLLSTYVQVYRGGIVDTGGEAVPDPRRTRHRDVAGVDATGRLVGGYINCDDEGVEERVVLFTSGSSETHECACLDGSGNLGRK